MWTSATSFASLQALTSLLLPDIPPSTTHLNATSCDVCVLHPAEPAEHSKSFFLRLEPKKNEEFVKAHPTHFATSKAWTAHTLDMHATTCTQGLYLLNLSSLFPLSRKETLLACCNLYYYTAFSPHSSFYGPTVVMAAQTEIGSAAAPPGPFFLATHSIDSSPELVLPIAHIAVDRCPGKVGRLPKSRPLQCHLACQRSS